MSGFFFCVLTVTSTLFIAYSTFKQQKQTQNALDKDIPALLFENAWEADTCVLLCWLRNLERKEKSQWVSGHQKVDRIWQIDDDK